MDGSHPVVEGLRSTLAGARSAAAFIAEVEGRVHQLRADMVDGRVLPKAEADGLRRSILELVRSDALPKLGGRNPNDALRLLDLLKAYGFGQLESERPGLVAARAARCPLPAPVTWPEIDELRAAAQRHPNVCTIAAPAQNAYFAKALQEDGVPLPDDLVGLYAACDGFDVSCVAASHVPVFSLLESKSIDTSDEGDGYPRRAVVFQGEDQVQLSVYRDRKKLWCLVYEYELQPIGKKVLELRDLVRFGLGRMNVSTPAALEEEFGWDRFFGIDARPV